MRFLPDAEGHESLASYLLVEPRAYTRAELISRWRRRALELALEAGDATRILPGIYAATTFSRSVLVRGEAANLWLPSALVSGDAALHLYNKELPEPAVTDLVAPYGTSKTGPPWLRIRTSTPHRVLCSPQGVDCAVPEYAVIDSWRSAGRVNRETRLYAALWSRTVSPRAVLRQLHQLPRVTGRRRLQLLLERFVSGVTSPLEALARSTAFADSCCSEFEWQAPVRVSGRKRIADILHRGAKVVIELDGEAYHSSVEARQRDRQRDVEFAAAGYVTLRFTFRDIRDRPRWCRDRALEVVASRLERPGGK